MTATISHVVWAMSIKNEKKTDKPALAGFIGLFFRELFTLTAINTIDKIKNEQHKYRKYKLRVEITKQTLLYIFIFYIDKNKLEC